MKHAHLLKIKFIGLNVQQIKRADLMPGKTKVERSYIKKGFNPISFTNLKKFNEPL